MSSYPFAGNTAGSCKAAFVVNVLAGQTCIGTTGLNGYASVIGFIANPPGMHIRVEYDNFFFVDNQRAISLKYGHEFNDNTMVVRNSYFMGYSRPTCTSCYSDKTISYCKNGYAVRMFVASLTG